ncbi:hypothetical protein BDW22DRAFT_1424674 [Trametopsis cervina]|nr:hypothetical protein BDW22DRAFT_1424674 [Trametopsis cervina]
MDPTRAEQKRRAEPDPFQYSWIRFPAQVFYDFLYSGWVSFRAYLPQLVPLVVFLVSIPVLLFFSISAGWFVWRSIAVGWETRLYLQYGDGGQPYARLELPTLASQQPYDVSLHLVVPTSPSNLDLGNFMASLTLSTPNGDNIISSRRSALVSPSILESWSFSLGARNTLKLDIPLLSNFALGTNKATAFVEIGRRDGWKTLGRGEGRELAVYSALLRGVVVHKGLRGILTRFPLITALTAAGTFFFISFVMLASCLLPMIEWQMQGQTESVEPPTPHEKTTRRSRREPSTPRVPRPKRSRSLGTPRLSMASQPNIKAEEYTVPIPSSSSTPDPLRRRRSRQFASDNE